MIVYGRNSGKVYLNVDKLIWMGLMILLLSFQVANSLNGR